MLKCPKCKKGNTVVIDSRDNGEQIRRRRKCLKCSYRHTTYEKIKEDEVEAKPLANEIFSSYVCDYCMHDCKDIRGNKRGCSKFSGRKLLICS